MVFNGVVISGLDLRLRIVCILPKKIKNQEYFNSNGVIIIYFTTQ